MSQNDLPAPEKPRSHKETEPLCLLTVISNPGKADSMARFALEKGALAAYHTYAHGTVPGHLLSVLGLSGVRRELVSLAVPRSQGSALMDALCEKFSIGRDKHGIAFLQRLEGRVDRPPADYVLIMAVVNEGEGEYVVDSARRCHPVGATILKALGTADHSKKTFDFEIIPQKEIVLIVVRSSYARDLYCAIYQEMRTDQPGRGVLFSLELERVAGILDMAPECPDEPAAEVDPRAPLESEPDYVALATVVDRGRANAILESLERHGGQGATILHFRRTVPDSKGWYGRLGDPEKEIVLTITLRPIAERLEKDLISNSVSWEGSHLILGQLDVIRFRRLSDPPSEDS